MRKTNNILGLLVILLVSLSGCQSQNSINFSEVWARPGWRDGNSAVFFVINNSTDVDDKLLSASSEVARAVEIHKTSMVDDVMKMERQDDVPLPAGEEVLFKPGGLHIMLIGLEDDLIVADRFTLILMMEKGGERIIDVVVKEP